MSRYEVRVEGRVVALPADARLDWIDRASGVARVTAGGRSAVIVVEGAGTDWTVTIGGRRVAATVRSPRERLLAEAATASATQAGPVDIAATLPGLVVAVAVEPGSRVEEGDSLLTLEAMKMQNEVRAPRAGIVEWVAVEAGTAVATGTLLVRLAPP
jgi:biotin carboxyl carrier protein